jgi:hypothetical protein
MTDGASAMFHVDPRWFETYWSVGQLRSRPILAAAMTWVVVVVALLGGGAVLFNHFHGKDPWNGYQQWERE